MDNIEFEPECKSRGMETCLHFRGAALNASEAGVFWLWSGAEKA